MLENKIEELMNTTLTNLKSVISAQTVIGEPIVTPDKSVIIPFSRVSFGVFTGGGEYSETNPKSKMTEYPMSAGGGAGVSVVPEGFIICSLGEQRIIRLNEMSSGDKWIDLLTSAVNKIIKK